MVAEGGYDEGFIAQVASALGRDARTAFAAACAERLWPLVERYALAVSLPVESLQALREALDAAWLAAAGSGVRRVVEGARETAEALVPFEDDSWVLESGYAQSGIAAIAYAARSWLSDDPQEAVWAARQVYEAADYGAQRSQTVENWVYSAGMEAELLHSPLVQAAIRGIVEDLAAVGKDSAEVVRQHAHAAAGDFVKLFP